MNIKEKKYFMLVICFIAAFFATGIIYALNTLDTGFRLSPGVESTIDLTSLCGECKKVTRTAAGDIFIPTRSCAEWNNFKSNAIGVTLTDCTPSFTCGTDTVADNDGNIYNTVQIGTQCWMKENLRVGIKITSCANGIALPSEKNCFLNGTTAKSQTDNNIIEKYCYDDIDAECDGGTPATKYGGLYQWDEAMGYSTNEGAQGICPAGWHIPTDGEQYILENYLKDLGSPCSSTRNSFGCSTAGAKLKVGGSSGFEGIYAGNRITDGGFGSRGTTGTFWSSTSSGGYAAKRDLVSPFPNEVQRLFNLPVFAHSVRCIKD